MCYRTTFYERKLIFMKKLLPAWKPIRYRWRSWDMNWKMTCETFWTKLSNRTRISVTIVPTKNYARFPIGKWIRLYTDRQQTDMETPIKVVFRRFKEGGVIALFPYIPWNESENTITSYMHAGQHGAADYKGIISGTLPATEKEYRSLLVELKSIGYGNLHVLERAHARQKFFL